MPLAGRRHVARLGVRLAEQPDSKRRSPSRSADRLRRSVAIASDIGQNSAWARRTERIASVQPNKGSRKWTASRLEKPPRWRNGVPATSCPTGRRKTRGSPPPSTCSPRASTPLSRQPAGEFWRGRNQGPQEVTRQGRRRRLPQTRPEFHREAEPAGARPPRCSWPFDWCLSQTHGVCGPSLQSSLPDPAGWIQRPE